MTTTDTTFNTPPPKSSQGLTLASRIGIGVGVGIGVLVFFQILLGVAIVLIIRHHRRNRNRKLPPHENLNPLPSSCKGKPELEGTVPSYGPKPELDAMAVRAELEGPPEDEGGDGVHVVKPELEGTPAQQGRADRKVFVKRKHELEGRRVSQPSITGTEVYELEGIRWI
jgi:hypothetical protein